MPSKKRSPPVRPQQAEPSSVSTHPPLAHLVAIAATLLSVPGTVLYVVCIFLLFQLKVDLAGNITAPLLLASAGLGLWMLALIGLVAAAWTWYSRNGQDRLFFYCIWLNGIITAGMMVLAVFAPQLG